MLGIALVALAALVFMAVLAPMASATKGPSQLNAYTYRDDADPLGPAYGWLDASPGATGATTYAMTDDSSTGFVPIGFPFEFFGTTYNSFGLNSNGYMYFGADAMWCSFCSERMGSTSFDAPESFIAAYWVDLNPSDACLFYIGIPPSKTISSKVFGTAPDRILVAQWTEVPHYGSGCASIVTFQIRLYETKNTIEIHYQDAPAYWSTTSVGIEGPGRTDYVDYEFAVVSYFNEAVRFSPSPPGAGDSYSVLQAASLVVPSVTGVLANDGPDVDGDPLEVDSATVTTPPMSSSFTMNSDGSFDYVPNPYLTGADSFVYRPSDNAGPSKNDVTVNINIVPRALAPIANDTSATTLEDLPISIPLDATDYNMDPLTYEIVTGPANGGLGTPLSGTYPVSMLYTPRLDYFGPDSFTYRVKDATAYSNVATVTITVVPVADRPVALDNAYMVDEDTLLSVPAFGPGADPCIGGGVLCNDADPDGGALTAILVSGPTNADSFTLNADGSFTYMPALDFYGTDSFRYQARDAEGELSAIANVVITVIDTPDPPVAYPDTYTILEQTLTTPASVLANDRAYGGTLSAALVSGPSLAASFTFRADGTFDYESVPLPSGGVDTFTYQAMASGFSSAIVTVTLNVISFDPPHAAFDVEVRGYELRLTDRSWAGDHPIASLSWDFGDGFGSVATDPVHLTPKPGYRLVRLTVTDTIGLSDTATQLVYVAPDAETMAPTRHPLSAPSAGASQVVGEGATVRLDATGNEAGLAYYWRQLDGVPVVLQGADTAQPFFVAPAVGPGEEARLVFELVLFDGTQFTPSGYTTVVVRDLNRPPLAVIQTPEQSASGGSVTLDASPSHDPDGEPLSFLWKQVGGEPATLLGADQAVATAELPATSEEALTFEVEVSDGRAADRAVAIVRIPAPGAPRAWFQADEVGVGQVEFREASQGGAIAVTWDFGDQSAVSHIPEPVHQYGASGRYLVTLIVEDAEGRTDRIARWVEVSGAVLESSSRTFTPLADPLPPAEPALQEAGSARDAAAPALWLVLAALGAFVIAARRRT
jgi:PKD repeat protein